MNLTATLRTGISSQITFAIVMKRLLNAWVIQNLSVCSLLLNNNDFMLLHHELMYVAGSLILECSDT